MIDGILFSDSNLEVRRYVEAIVLGESQEVLDAHLRNMKLDESSQERILIELIKELRKDPSRLQKLHKDIENFKNYQPFSDTKSNIGAGVFNSAILAIDFTAIWFGTTGAVDSLAQDFMQSYQSHTVLTAVMMLIGSGIIAEVINLRRTAADLVRDWKKKRKKMSLVKKIQQILNENSHLAKKSQLSYRTSQHIEKAAAETLPLLISKMNEDAQSSWRARRKLKSFSKSLKENFTNGELEKMGLYDFKKLSKLEQFKLNVPIVRWFFKKHTDVSIDVSERDSYRRALAKLSSIKLELRDTSRKTNLFLLNKFSIGLITVASAVQGLSLAVHSADPGVIDFNGVLGEQLLYIKNYEPIITVLTVSAIALSLDFQALTSGSRKTHKIRAHRKKLKKDSLLLENSLRKESRSSFVNKKAVRPAMQCTSLL